MDETPAVDVAHLRRQIEFSERTFGPGPRTKGICDHIRKELVEIEADPLDVKEWVDVIILAFDGAWRTGCSPEDILLAIHDKQGINESRKWPDWRTADTGQAIEHTRGARVYLSGPITNWPTHRSDFARAEEVVRSLGHEPVNPLNIPACRTQTCNGERPADAEQRAGFAHSWECYMKTDVAALVTCDYIYLLSGWERSRGARRELSVAMLMEIPVLPPPF